MGLLDTAIIVFAALGFGVLLGLVGAAAYKLWQHYRGIREFYALTRRREK